MVGRRWNFDSSDLAMRSLLLRWAFLLASCAMAIGYCPAEESAAKVQSSQPHGERVLIIIRDDCPKCEAELERLRRPGGPFEALQAAGWKIDTTPESHVQIVNRDEVPELAKSLGATDYPAVAGMDADGVTRYFKSGCTTPLDQWTFGWLLTGKNERPTEAVPEPVRVASTGSYRLRGNHWSIEGDFNPSQEKVLTHLHSSAHARSTAGYSNIDAWSMEELRSLHDDIHEREGGLSSGRGVASAKSNRPSYLIPKGQR